MIWIISLIKSKGVGLDINLLKKRLIFIGETITIT